MRNSTYRSPKATMERARLKAARGGEVRQGQLKGGKAVAVGGPGLGWPKGVPPPVGPPRRGRPVSDPTKCSQCERLKRGVHGGRAHVWWCPKRPQPRSP